MGHCSDVTDGPLCIDPSEHVQAKSCIRMDHLNIHQLHFPRTFLRLCLCWCVRRKWDTTVYLPPCNRSMSPALAVKSIPFHTRWPPNKNTLRPTAASPDSLKGFFISSPSCPPPPLAKINRVREGAANVVKVATGIFCRTRRSQQRYESLMRDVSAPRRGNVLKTWLWAHGEEMVGGERKRERVRSPAGEHG